MGPGRVSLPVLQDRSWDFWTHLPDWPQILHYDERPHTAKKTSKLIQKLKFDLLPHPPYSPDLAPRTFVFSPNKVKALLRGGISNPEMT